MKKLLLITALVLAGIAVGAIGGYYVAQSKTPSWSPIGAQSLPSEQPVMTIDPKLLDKLHGGGSIDWSTFDKQPTHPR